LSNRPSFSKYGKSFQEDLVHLILDDRPFADQILEVLDTNFLELEYLRLFTSKIVDYRQRYSKHPSQQIIDTILQTELEREDKVVSQQTTEYFNKISISEVEGSEYIKEQSLDFCRKQNLKEAMLKSVDLLQSSSFDEISKIINDSLKLGSENNFGYDYLVDFEERYVPRFRNPITTGWKEMDEIAGGGLGKSELGVVVAPTGAGKSMVLVHLGSQAIMEGKTVIHYTLELQETVIGKRYDSCITEFPLSELSVFKDEIYEKIKDLDGRLIVKEYPTKSATTGTIKNHLNKLVKRGIEPDMIIVDYADLLKPMVVRKEKRNELESIYEELRALSTEFGCPIWTASQTNRSGLNAEVITMEQISEAFNKCFVADFIFSVSRTVEDKQNNTGKIFVAKNRNGPDGMIYNIFMDTSNVKIRVLPQNNAVTAATSNGVVTSPVALTPKMQRNYLQTKYQKFKGTTK
jgi:replicative DNA helicase